MGTFLGGIIAAMVLVALGRGLKGRDFLGLAAAMMVVGWVGGALVSPIVFQAEDIAVARQVARGAADPGQFVRPLATVVAGAIAALIALIPGVMLVLVAKPSRERAD